MEAYLNEGDYVNIPNSTETEMLNGMLLAMAYVISQAMKEAKKTRTKMRTPKTVKESPVVNQNPRSQRMASR